MLRAIQEIKPRFVIAENVFGITNIDGGLVFQQVCLDLEGEGYEVQPFIIPACAKNAPHRRDRCWFIATDTNGNGLHKRNGNDEINPGQGGEYAQRNANTGNVNGDVTDTDFERFKQHNITPISNKKERFNNKENFGSGYKCWENFPTQPAICSGNDGIPAKLDGITFSKWRNESIKGYGNAIVPQIAHQLFQILETL